MFVFQGMKTEDGPYVTVNGQWFDPALSLKIRNHSPDGFNWGYGGSGPAQLALGILLLYLPVRAAEILYQRFKAEVIAGLHSDGWLLTEKEVVGWIERNRHRLLAGYNEVAELPDDVLEVIDDDDVGEGLQGG